MIIKRVSLFFLFFVGSFSFLSADSTLDGQGNILTLGTSATLTVSAGSTVTLKNLTLQNLSGTALVMESSASTLILDNVQVCMNGSYSFTQGTLVINRDVIFTGTSVFSYQSSSTSRINTASCLTFDVGTTFSYAPPTNSRYLLSMTDQTSQLYLNNCTLCTTTTGLVLSRGTLILDKQVTLSGGGLTLSNCLAFGDAINTNDLFVQVYGGDLVTNCLIDIYRAI